MNEIFEKVKSIIIEQVDVDLSAHIIDEETNLENIGLNSISFIKIIIEIEEQFNINVDDDYLTMDSLKKVKDFVDIIIQHKAQ